MYHALVLLFKLLISHFLCDFALQTPWIAQNKNRHNAPKDNALPPGQQPQTIWPYVLTAHAMIHAGGTWVAMGEPLAAGFMFLTHWALDYMKCENLWGFHTDQFMHLSVLVILCLPEI